MKLSDIFNRKVLGSASAALGIACAATFVIPALAPLSIQIAFLAASTLVGAGYGIYRNKRSAPAPTVP